MQDLKKISHFVQQQLPGFYREEGPNFVAFCKAYYEWMEQSGQILNHTRSLLDYKDIDQTSAQFLQYFKNQYINQIPEQIAADKRLLQKHILELYRTKGTPRGYEFLFRLLFDEDVEVFVPGQYVFKPSDNRWIQPRYIEVTDHDNLGDLTGTAIAVVGGGGTATVESVQTIINDDRRINICYLSNIRGTFRTGDRIYQTGAAATITETNGPLCTGSLTVLLVSDGGGGYSLGDRVSVLGGGGIGGIAKVAATKEEVGGVAFVLQDGGSGYTINADISVLQTYELVITSASGAFTENEVVTDSGSSANAIMRFANSTFMRITNHDGEFIAGSTVTGASSGATATIVRALGGVGNGAGFQIGAVTDLEALLLNTDIINDYLGLTLENATSGFEIAYDTSTGTFVGPNVNSTANSIWLSGTYSSSNSVANGEVLANATIGVTNVYCYQADGGSLWCTSDSDAQLTNANLVPGAILVSSVSGSVFTLIDTPQKTTVTGNGTIVSQNSTVIVCNAVSGYFVPTKTLFDGGSANTANITGITRLTDWNFLNSSNALALDNLSSALANTLQFVTVEGGRILFLSQIDPGRDYLTEPWININEPLVAAAQIDDGSGNFKGNNAVVTSSVENREGIITAVEVIDSGYGYQTGQSVTLHTANTSQTDGTATAFILEHGRGSGYWQNRKSFVSDTQKLQDSSYYQDYSYDLIVQRTISAYEHLVRELVHPAGYALFGRFRQQAEIPAVAETSQFSLTQS